MKFIGEPEYQHGSNSRMGILLVNLGTPDDTSVPSVRRYLKEFLSDPRVVEVARPLWWLILNGVILRFRPAKTAEAYKTVWDPQTGSPLLSIGMSQRAAIQEQIAHYLPENTPVALAMRYGNPSISSALEELREAKVRRLLVLPLYPQYSGSTVASVFDEVTRQLSRTRWIPETRFINQYFDFPDYISALADSVRESWKTNGKAEKLVMSFHGIPQRYRTAGDPYFCQCQATARLLAKTLSLSDSEYLVVFQSRFGREPWLQPYCDKTLEKLPAEGTKSVDLICPGFSADCLETIEEINVENREIFMEAGGERFNYIDALNDSPNNIDSLCKLLRLHASGWPEAQQDNTHNDATRLSQSRERALALGANA
ncbi:ferrochelatase [Chromatiales bacterium (ex Bugula neritina AB1)]|nr:ferrochelatase [Chromatiales bacterium (ex Bugula neritina AB1)]